jgi:two-component system sensor histidine kinase ArlS
MRKLRSLLSELPIQWKLIIWSSLLLCFLFTSYNVAQYYVINYWLMKQEEQTIQKNMDELQIYFAEKKADLNVSQIKDSQSFIDKVNQRNQMIRVLDNKGSPILTVTDQLPEDWIAPKYVTQTELISLWHITDHLIVIRSPLTSANFNGTIEIVENLEIMDKISDLHLLIMLIGGLGALILSGLGGTVLTRQLLKPIKTITATMHKIKTKGLHERVVILDNHDEISKLATMFNGMMDQLELAFQQQKQFVEDASHELRTPIAIMEGHLSLLNRWAKDDPVLLGESLQASLQELNRLKGLVQDLLELSRAESVIHIEKQEIVDPVQVITAIVKNMAMLHPDYVFDMKLIELTGIRLAVDPHHLEQILLIFLDNAVKYSGDSKEINILGSLNNKIAEIQIIDHGVGIPQTDLPFVFDRLYRVDKARSSGQAGHGLGLSIARRLIEGHGGTVYISSLEHEGTRVLISLPIYK